jgi:ComF family protein
MCLACLKQEKRPWSRGISVARLDGVAKEMVHRLKYASDTAIARTFASLANERFLESEMQADNVIPIPTHWTRRLVRGFNQVNLIAGVFSKLSSIPLSHELKRIKPTPKQASLDRAARLLNLQGAFAAHKNKVQGKKILLMDDVITTGATMTAAVSALLDAGAADVAVLSIARA